MENLNIEYLETRSDLLLNMGDEEFTEWLNCDDCVLEDYEILIDILKREEMHERLVETKDYLRSLGVV